MLRSTSHTFYEQVYFIKQFYRKFYLWHQHKCVSAKLDFAKSGAKRKTGLHIKLLKKDRRQVCSYVLFKNLSLFASYAILVRPKKAETAVLDC